MPGRRVRSCRTQRYTARLFHTVRIPTQQTGGTCLAVHNRYLYPQYRIREKCFAYHQLGWLFSIWSRKWTPCSQVMARVSYPTPLSWPKIHNTVDLSAINGYNLFLIIYLPSKAVKETKKHFYLIMRLTRPGWRSPKKSLPYARVRRLGKYI